MPVQLIQFLGAGAPASPDGLKVIARSSSASDTSRIATLVGPVSGSASTEDIALNGQLEVKGTLSFDSLSFAGLDANPVGTISLLAEGNPGIGYAVLEQNPADLDTITLGLLGHTKVYQFRKRGQTTIAAIAGASLTNGTYFDISLSGVTNRFYMAKGETSTITCANTTTISGKYFDLYPNGATAGSGAMRVWINLDGVGVAPATPTGGTLLAVTVASSGITTTTVMTACAAALEADGRYRASSSAAVLTVTDLIGGDDTVPLTGGANFGSITTAFSGAVTPPSTPGGGTLTKISYRRDATGSIAADTNAQVAAKIQAVLDVFTNLTASVNSNTVTVSYDIAGVMTVTDTGSTTFTITSVNPGSSAATANDVYVESTAALTAENLKLAVNASGVAGTNYGTGTTALVNLTATRSGQVVTLTDPIACDRQIAWAFASSVSYIQAITPTGGVDGTLVGTLVSGGISLFDTFTLDNEGLSATNLPPRLAAVGSDPVAVQGGITVEAIATIAGKGPAAGSATITWKVQTSTDAGVTWRDGSPGTKTLAATLDRVTPAERISMMRVYIIANNAILPVPVNMKVVS